MTNDNKKYPSEVIAIVGIFGACTNLPFATFAALAAIWSVALFTVFAWITVAVAIITGLAFAGSFALFIQEEKAREKRRAEAMQDLEDGLAPLAAGAFSTPEGDGGAMQARMLKAVEDSEGRA